LRKDSLDALLVSHPANVYYLSGFRGDDSWLWVGVDQAILLSDSRFTDQIADECVGLEAIIRKPGRGQTLVSTAADVARSAGWRRLAVESTSLHVADWEKLRADLPDGDWRPSEGYVEDLRVIKDEHEIETMRSAVAIAQRAFAVLRATLRPEDREKDLADGLESTVRRLGGDGSAFPPICAVGPRAALPHAIPTLHRVEESPILLVDWGARSNRYNSDLTRVLITGPLTPKIEKVYNAVLRAEESAIRAIRPGAIAGEIDQIARHSIEEAGFGRSFTHSTGHGLGLDVHEAPGLRPKADTVLRPGMVVTVEPGIYLKGWGGVRIEDDVLVTPDGHEILTSVPKRLEEICLEA
jgi:Xaa-Pro aminopeptidase